jgi:hypothetical protein
MQHRHITRKNLHGSSRAEGFLREKRFTSEKRVKNLAKAVDDGAGQSGDRPDIGDEDDDENENLRKKSRSFRLSSLSLSSYRLCLQIRGQIPRALGGLFD